MKTVKEAAADLGVSVQGVRKSIATGKLEAIRIGRSVMLEEDSVERYRSTYMKEDGKTIEEMAAESGLSLYRLRGTLKELRLILPVGFRWGQGTKRPVYSETDAARVINFTRERRRSAPDLG